MNRYSAFFKLLDILTEAGSISVRIITKEFFRHFFLQFVLVFELKSELL